MPAPSFKLAMIQMRVIPGDKTGNLHHASQLVAAAAAQGAQVAVLPEAMPTGWTDPSSAALADEISVGETCRFLARLAVTHRLSCVLASWSATVTVCSILPRSWNLTVDCSCTIARSMQRKGTIRPALARQLRPVARDFRLWIGGVSNTSARSPAAPWAGRKCTGSSMLVGPDGEVAQQGPYGETAETI